MKYKYQISIFISALIFLFSPLTFAQDKGLTWTKIKVEPTSGVIDVGCGHTPGAGNQCNPRTGDTPCSAKIPVLCLLNTKLKQPRSLHIPNKYHQWSGSVIATSAPVAGSKFKTLAQVNTFCQQQFGSNWTVAEFHQGWGWYFKAYGNVGSNYNQSRRRFWIDINDQPNATCWKHREK